MVFSFFPDKNSLLYFIWNVIFQAQIIDSELTAKLLGRGVAVSPVVTVEPRRRKFHKAITLSMPAPRPHTQGMTNQYSTSSAPTLRLLCSISGTIKIVCFYFSNRSVWLLEMLLEMFKVFPKSSCNSTHAGLYLGIINI